jgi:hypothetical protein
MKGIKTNCLFLLKMSDINKNGKRNRDNDTEDYQNNKSTHLKFKKDGTAYNVIKKNNPPVKKEDTTPSKKSTTIVPPKKKDDLNDLNQLLFFLMPPRQNTTSYPNNIPLKIDPSDKECNNPTCDHKTFEEDDMPVLIPDIKEITNIDDLISLGKSYHCKKNKEFFGMNLRVLCNLTVPLTELHKLVGMVNIKEKMVDQILFFLQGNHVATKCGKCTDCIYNMKCLKSQTDMLHTVITGPPGVGKTELGKILGKVYKELGVLSKGHFKIVSRSDLIAGYLGQTAIKTQKAIDEAMGGVLFIDEAYALGNAELRDSFSKECIDTLNQNLSERRDFLCIIAGYEQQLEECFFKYNEGLRRRFTFRYDLVPYKYTELMHIFEKKIYEIEWDVSYHSKHDDSEDVKESKNKIRTTVAELFKKNEKKFPNYGGDIETLVLNCKISHTRRCTFNKDEKRRVLSFDDIKNGINRFTQNRKYVVHNDSDSRSVKFYS